MHRRLQKIQVWREGAALCCPRVKASSALVRLAGGDEMERVVDELRSSAVECLDDGGLVADAAAKQNRDLAREGAVGARTIIAQGGGKGALRHQLAEVHLVHPRGDPLRADNSIAKGKGSACTHDSEAADALGGGSGRVPCQSDCNRQRKANPREWRPLAGGCIAILFQPYCRLG